jgi:hypothetical protein
MADFIMIDHVIQICTYVATSVYNGVTSMHGTVIEKPPNGNRLWKMGIIFQFVFTLACTRAFARARTRVSGCACAA